MICLIKQRCMYLIVCNILRWNFFRSPHLHVPGGLSVTRDYNPEWSVVTGLCAVWNVYRLVDLLACLIQYIWNPKFISLSMDYNYDNLIQYSAIFKSELMNPTGHPPFLAESFQQLKEKILHKELPPPKVKGIELIEGFSNVNSLCHLKTKITRCFQHTSFVFSRKQIFIETISRFS